MPSTSYVVDLILKINGSEASPALLEDILQVSVEESLHLPGMFTIVIKNDPFSARSTDQIWKHQNLFEIGTEIIIGFGSSTTKDPDYATQNKGVVFQGEVTAIENYFTKESQAPIIIRGYDVSHRLHRGRFNRSFQNVKDSDVVSKVIGEVGISAGTVSATTATHEYVFQENQTNMEFLRERAARNGFELFVQDNKLNFRKPKSGGSIALKWLEDLQSFKVRVSSGEQVKKVEVRGWDYEKKEAIVSTAESEVILTSNQHGKGPAKSSAFKGKPSTPTMIVVDQPVYTKVDSGVIAQSLCDELGGEYIQADASAIGNPLIRPGKVITLTEMGKYSGSYYVTETRHLFLDRVYTTEFTVRGLRGGDILTVLTPQTRLQPGQTLMIGVVTNNNDPKKWSRVKVKFPTLTEEHESHWARVVAIGAGVNRGFDCLPEINDEVLVAFEHGDIHRPFVLGGVWNGKDAAPTVVTESVVDSKVRLRTFKTRTGHTLQFVEEDKGSSKKGVYTDTVYKHKIHCNDSEKKIDIKTGGSHYALLDDQNKKIEIKTSGGHKILMDDTGKNIDMISTGNINVKSGTSGTSKDININAGNINLTAMTKITLKVGANTIELSQSGININGVKIEAKATGMANYEASGMMTVKATGMMTVESSAITNIKGSMVMIN
jgi:phage protein D/phage baseplate assembly protein gpV